ncbi:MAG TPA: class A beta-lactamase-related serine hydrolase [Blastocatellia bacterium]|nr:class A beta-lactamase-related serine hydrolase [Blastocatellia bacterium]
MKNMFLAVAFALMALGSSALAQSKLDQAKLQIEKLIVASGAEVVSVAVYDLQTKQTLLLNERVNLHAASTMKLPVMMEIFRLVEEKKLRLTDSIEVQNKFFSIIDGSEFRLNKSDDSDEEVYNRIGQKMTVLDLMEHMITWSSNLATNILIERVGPENVMKLMAELGANDIRVLRGVEDSKAFQAGKNNTTTAYDLMLLFKLIAENKFKSKKACEKMVEILSAQHFNDGIPAGLPTATKVAHKTGEITKHKHDAGIVYPLNRKPYVIVVLTKGIANDTQSSKLIADISSVVYRALAN